MNAIRGVFGQDSPHYQRFEHEMSSITNNMVWERKLYSLRGIFLGAKSDVDGGHLFMLEASFTGEVFGDFVATAKAALAEGHHPVAAVLACAALEDALKRYARANGLTVDGKVLEDIVGALKSKGLVSGPQKALLAAMPKIRNSAMHADWSKITLQDAGSVIGYVEQFLLEHFS
jgi:HEPN domain-containing protein